jgi:hypothetical protein
MTVAAFVERLRCIPESARSYECDARRAELHFGFDDEALRALQEAGLPCADDGDGLRFDACDLHYVGLRLRTATTYLWAARGWARGLALFAERSLTHVSIAYAGELEPDADQLPAEVRLPDGDRRSVVLAHGRRVAEARIALRGDWPPLPAPAAAIVREVVDPLSFCLLPPPLRGDVDFVRRSGLSDCLTAAQLVVAEWERNGWEARVSSGFLVSLPYSTSHG